MTQPAATPVVRLLPPRPQAPLPEPDGCGQAVLAAVAQGDNLVVLGGAGTGKTCLALRVLTEAVLSKRDAVLLSPTRLRVDRLRRQVSHLLSHGGAGSDVVRVRTPASLAQTILTTSLTRRPHPLPAPVLLTGAEEQATLAEMVGAVTWPGIPSEAAGSRAFINQLRDVLARAGELGVEAQDLAVMGEQLQVPVWAPVSQLLRTWDAQGRPSAARRSQVRKMDTARMQDRAVEALREWDTDGVLDPRPVPDLVVVDDYQDCTAATARLLEELARPDADGHRAQVVVLGDPDTAVETFRGGTPSLLTEAQASGSLSAKRLTLRSRHRGNPALARVWDDQSARVPVTGDTSYRSPSLATAKPPAGAGPQHHSLQPAPSGATGVAPATSGTQAPSGVSALIASSQVEEAAHVARLLREESIHFSTPWGDMAVIARSSAQAASLARELRRRGVPLAASNPAVLLRAEPVAAALTNVVGAALAGRLGSQPPAHQDDPHHPDGATQPLAERGPVLDLLTSPLVGLTHLDLRRLRRHLRDGAPAETTADQHLLQALSSPQAAQELAQDLAGVALGEQGHRLERAARVMAGLRELTDTPGTEDPPLADVEALLWAAWDASGCADRWQEAALRLPATRLGADTQEGQGRAERGDALLAEAAEHDLDVVTALFKRAEVWAERNPGAPATDFLDELAKETLPSDSVAPHGVRPEGVSVLTPASAAGGQWEVVVVMGLGRDAWPDLRLRDTLTRSGLLVDAVTGRLPLGPDGALSAALDQAAARAQVRGDERRMLLAALTRASRRLLVTAVSDADNAPSSFLLEVAKAAGQSVLTQEGEPVIAQDVGDLTLRGLVGELRHALVAGHLPEAGPVERERAQVAAELLATLAAQDVPGAHPDTWLGLEGPSSTGPLVEPGQSVQISPSDVEGLTSCPLKWFLQRNGAGGPASSAQRLGDVVHLLAEQAQKEGLRGAALMERFEELEPTLGYPDTWLGAVAARHARDVVERLGAYLDSVPGQVDVEVRVGASLRLAPPKPGVGPEVEVSISGYIDRLEHLPDGNGGKERVRLIDLKTGQRVYAEPEHHPQLATYRAALQALGYEVDGAALVLLGKEPRKRDAGMPVLAPQGAALAPSPDPDTGQDWASDMLWQAAQAASGASLEARVGEQCRSCVVRDSCPAQPEGRKVVA